MSEHVIRTIDKLAGGVTLLQMKVCQDHQTRYAQ